MIWQTRKPWQLLNPFAPASYGGVPGIDTGLYVAGQPGGAAFFRLEY